MDPSLPGLYAAPLFALLIAAEAVVFARRGRAYPWRDSGTSLLIALGYKVAGALTALLVGGLYAWVWNHRVATVPLTQWWAWPLLFVGVEFTYYWFHRWHHEVRWFWATHSVHHSPREMNFAAAYRLGWTGAISGAWLFWLPLVWLGFDPRAVLFMVGLNLVYQFWLHTGLVPKLGRFEWAFNTPSHHRVHHSVNPSYLDTNYGGVLIVFDRLFGTFAAERPDEPCRYGLVHPIESRNPLRIVFNEWLAIARDLTRARNVRDIVMLLFGPPGWRADGAGLTTAIIRGQPPAAATPALAAAE
jgi:sterol desaturase/sphingolipid hydroxylase (fatty acid hydroxylase superfamily)